MDYQSKFEEIARKFIRREGLETVLANLAKSDFYTAPASTRYHDSVEQGLVKHTLRVFSELDAGMGVIDRDEMETIAIIALFHDICKIGFYKVEERNTKDEKGKWIKVPYYTVEDLFPFGHGEKSVYLLLQAGFKLTDEEAMAIRWHMGLSVPKEEYLALGEAFKQYPMALELHIADMRATYLE